MLKDVIKCSPISYAAIASSMGICELSIRNKAAGKAKITNSEWLMLGKLLNLSDEELEHIKEEHEGCTM